MLRRRMLVPLLVLGLGLIPALGPVATATDDPDDGRLRQVFHPGALDGAVVPSAEIPRCTGLPDDPPDCYDGEMLELQAREIGRNALEPTIAVDADGTAYMAAAAYDGVGYPRTWIMRSTDGGVSWEKRTAELAGQTNPPATLDPWVHVDEDTGRVFSIDLTLACSYLSWSDDKGETWTTNPAACGQPVNDHQTIVTAPPPPGLPTVDYPNVLYYCFNRVVDSSCSRSLDGGVTWTPAGLPAYLGYVPGAGAGFYGVEGFCGGLHGHVQADDEGRIFVPRGLCDQPFLAMSEDGGTTWTQTRVSTELTAARGHLAEHFSVSADAAENVYYLWRDEQYRKPWLAISTDNGRTFGAPTMIAPPGVAEVNFATVAAGDEGELAVLLIGTEDGNRSSNTRPWNAYLMVTENALDEEPLWLSTTANPVADPMHRGACNGRCGNMFDFLDVDVAPSGELWAALTDTCTSSQCRGTNGTAGSSNDARGVAVRQIGGPLAG